MKIRGLIRRIPLIIVSLLAVFPVIELYAKESAEVTLRLWNIPSRADTSVTGRARRAVFEKFVETHPQINIKAVSGINVDGPAAESFIFMAMAGGTAPDVFTDELNFRSIQSWIDQKFLYPLDEYFEKDEYILSKIHPKAMPVVSKKGRIYALPWQYYVKGLYYRRDLFKEAGLSPNHAPENWDELYEYAQRLTYPEKGQYGFGFAGGWLASWHLMDFIWQAGGEMVRQDSNGTWKTAFNEEPGVKALEFYKILAHREWERAGKRYKGVIGGTYQSTQQDFMDGRAAMMFGYGTDELMGNPGFDPAVIGFAPLPAGPAGIRANELNALCLGINATIMDNRVRDAASEYIRFLLGNEAGRIKTKVFVEAGYGKFTSPDSLKKFGYEKYLDEIPDDWVQANKDLFKTGQPEPYAPNYKSIQTVELTDVTDRILTYPDADPRTLLNGLARKCDELYFGSMPPEEMRKRKNAGRIILFIIAGITLFFFVRILKILSQDDNISKAVVLPTAEARFRKHFYAWLFMAPALASIAIWSYYPLIKGSLMAFYDYRIMGGGAFVGVDNFIEAIFQPIFWKAMLNTVYYVALSLGLGFFAPLILALMLTEIPKGTFIYRTVYYLPAITTGLVIMFLWKIFYDPSPHGFLNIMAGFIGISPQGWLNDPKLAMLCIVIPGIWAGAGPGSLIYQAALKSVPEELYEAADLDGTSALGKVWYITLPTLKPLIIINFVGAFIGSFHAMQNIFVMTGGGPMNSTYTIGIHIFYNAFLFLKFGLATALAWILGSILIGFTMYQLKMLKEVKFTTAG